MLYKILDNKLQGIEKKNVLERDVQKLVESNLPLLFELEFVDSEYSIENVRFDTLAFSRDENAPVILEFKKTFEKSVFDQGLEYLNILFSRKADFTLKFHKALSIPPDPGSIAWENSRVIFVGNRFSERQKRAVSFQGLPIELWTFDWFDDGLFRLENEVLSKEASLDFASAAGETEPVERVRREIKEYSLEYHQKNAEPKIWELFEKFESALKDLGDFEIVPRKAYITVRGKGASFCVAKLLKSKMQVEFGKKKDIQAFGANNLVHDISPKAWNHALMYEVSSPNDLDELLLILKRAYDLV